MAGLEALTAMIYHERQQEGSMLCAQHALNSLLQGPYFTAPDLATIADSFDVLEHDAMQGSSQRSTSRNMDDTGFFSVQVMEKALDVWGLHLLRWRSEQMRPYQDAPHKQLAFVLNLEQHWFTLRRFGPARTEPDSDPGEGHWFNLNSHYPAPNWVSKTYLDMFLRQSEEEGYSVFVVVQADPHMPLALPRTEADLAAATLDAPDSMPGAFPREASATGQVIIPDEGEYDINSEDVELQAALAASLTGADQSFGQHAYVPQAPVPAPPLRRAPVPPVTPGNDDEDEDNDDDIMEVDSVPVSASASASTTAVNTNPDPEDPVAASMARNREMLERMKRVQEAALRETYEEEMAGLRPQTGPAPPQRRQTRAEQEREELERAIAASMAAAGTSHSSPNTGDEDEDEDEDVEEVDKENTGTRRHEPVPQASSASVPSAPAPVPARPQAGESHRVYDDEDEQLQAALRASLETMPEDYVHPPSPPGPPPPRHASTLPVGSGLSPLAPPQAPAEPTSTTPNSVDESSEASQSKTKAEDTEEDEGASSPPAQVDVEEMRKRRLARFGGQA